MLYKIIFWFFAPTHIQAANFQVYISHVMTTRENLLTAVIISAYFNYNKSRSIVYAMAYYEC